MLEVNMSEIKRIMRDIYISTKMKCVLYDESFNIVYAYPGEMCPFCAAVREEKEYRKKCLKCDLNGFNESVKSKKTYIYNCHMGLTESVSPIIKNNTVIGFIMIGQVVGEADVKNIEHNISIFKNREKCGFLREELHKMDVINRRRILSVTNVIDMCTSYLWLKRFISVKRDTTEFVIKEYITEHLCDELSVKALCEEFNISKSGLYSISRKFFGKGISEFIRDTRMEKAKQLLNDTDMTVGEIAERVGIIDTNYFTKIFKRYTSKTPTEWRRNE